MNKLIFPLFLFLLASPLAAQKKELTLSDAVLEQRKSLAPENLSSLSWIADSDRYYWINKDNKSIEIASAEEEFHAAVNLAELNNLLRKQAQDSLKALPQINWLDKETFYFKNNCVFYSYNIDDAQLQALLSYDEAAENLEYHAGENLLAYTIENNVYIATENNPKIQVTSFEDGNIVSGQAIHRFEFGIKKGLFWSNDGKKLAFYQMDESEVENYPKINYNTYPATVENLKYPMAGKKSHYAKVVIYDLEEKTTTYLKTQGEKDHYLTNFSWNPADNKIYLAEVNREQNHMKLNLYDAESGQLEKTLFEEKNSKYVEPEQAVQLFDELEDQFIWLSERDGYKQLYLYSTNGKLKKKLTNAKYDVKEVLGLSKDGEELYFSRVDGLMDTKIYSVNLKTGKIKTITNEPGTHSGKLNSSGEYLIDAYSSLDVPREINLYKDGKLVKNLLTAKNPLTEYKTGDIRLFRIKAADNKTDLQCRMILPEDFDSTIKYPVLVYVYGGPHAQMITNSWMAGAPLWMLYMANQGYVVFTVDNRGSANRGLEFEQAIFRELGKVEMADQMEGVKYLKKQPFVDANRMAVHGWSFGGFMTISMMLKHPGVFQVGVAGGPVTDWSYYEIMYTERYMDSPETNPVGFKNTTLKNYADSLQGDLLLIHGMDDDIVVLQHNIMLLNTFIKKDIDVDFFNYPGHAHNVRGKDRVHLLRKVLNYVIEKMPEPE